MAPTWNPDQKGVKVQIIDVFALELATGTIARASTARL
jgi:hypothetical protein